MRFTVLALTALAATTFAKSIEDGADISIKTVTSTSTHLKTVTSTGAAPATTEEPEIEVLYTVTQTPKELLAALRANNTTLPVIESSSTAPANNFTRPADADKTDDGKAPEKTGGPDGDKESAAGRREVAWGVIAGGLVGAAYLGF